MLRDGLREIVCKGLQFATGNVLGLKAGDLVKEKKCLLPDDEAGTRSELLSLQQPRRGGIEGRILLSSVVPCCLGALWGSEQEPEWI